MADGIQASGLAVVDKPAGWTSHDVVARLRTTIGQRRIGHAGTLDPDATGVLLVGVGPVTRLLRFLSALRKAYEAEVVLGVETSTLDSTGEVTATHEMSGVTLDQVRDAARRFVGDIEQVPPMVSAVKIGGRRLHHLARQGQEVERPARPVTVHRLEVGPGPAGEPGVFAIAVECSSGTYVRTLAADIGAALGGGAHLRALRRTSVGSFTLAEARALDEVEVGALLPPAAALRDYPSVTVGPEVAAEVGHGRVLTHDVLGVADGAVPGPWAVLDASGALLAVYEAFGPERADRSGMVKPAVVLTSA